MKIQIRITGTSPLLLHSDAAAVPGHPINEAKSRLSAKRKKSTEDQQELLYLDFLGAFYPGEGIVFPTWNIARSIGDAAAAAKQKSASERALTATTQQIAIIYDGPTTREEMWAAGTFADIRMVKNSGAGSGRVPRCRPIFNDWAMEATFLLDTRALELHDLQHHATVAGELYGVGDGRRLGFGRYNATVTEL